MPVSLFALMLNVLIGVPVLPASQRRRLFCFTGQLFCGLRAEATRPISGTGPGAVDCVFPGHILPGDGPHPPYFRVDAQDHGPVTITVFFVLLINEQLLRFLNRDPARLLQPCRGCGSGLFHFYVGSFLDV